MIFDVGQPAFDPVIVKRWSHVVEPQKMQDRAVKTRRNDAALAIHRVLTIEMLVLTFENTVTIPMESSSGCICAVEKFRETHAAFDPSTGEHAMSCE